MSPEPRSRDRHSNWFPARRARRNAAHAPGRFPGRFPKIPPKIPMSSICSAPQRFPDAGRPLLHIKPVMMEEGKGDAFQSEADAGGVRDTAIFEIETPFRAEGI